MNNMDTKNNLLMDITNAMEVVDDETVDDPDVKPPTPAASTSLSASPPTPPPATSTTIADLGISPKIHNVAACVELKCRLDMVRIALRVKNSEYNPRKFHGVVMRIQNPLTTALAFPSGKLIVTGAREEKSAHLAARKFARILQKLGFNVQFSNFRIMSMFATCDMRFPIHLDRLYSNQYQFARYEPELFPGLIYRMIQPKVVLLIFVTGKVVLSGGHDRVQLTKAIENIYPLLKSFRKQ